MDSDLRALERLAEPSVWCIDKVSAARERLELAWLRAGRGWHGETVPENKKADTSRRNHYWHYAPSDLIIEQVAVPAGPFIMGSESEFEDERPMHMRTLPLYYVTKYPITWREYLVFCCATNHPQPHAPNWGIQTEHPVVNVSHSDAEDFCKWAGLSLLTEAQWEKAARGGINLQPQCDGCKGTGRVNPDVTVVVGSWADILRTPPGAPVIPSLQLPEGSACPKCHGFGVIARRYPWGNDAPTPDKCVWSGHPIYGNISTAPVVIKKCTVCGVEVHDVTASPAEIGMRPNGSLMIREQGVGHKCGEHLVTVPARPNGASPYGAMDMAGNVWEWCVERYVPDAYKRYVAAHPESVPPFGCAVGARTTSNNQPIAASGNSPMGTDVGGRASGVPSPFSSEAAPGTPASCSAHAETTTSTPTAMATPSDSERDGPFTNSLSDGAASEMPSSRTGSPSSEVATPEQTVSEVRDPFSNEAGAGSPTPDTGSVPETEADGTDSVSEGASPFHSEVANTGVASGAAADSDVGLTRANAMSHFEERDRPFRSGASEPGSTTSAAWDETRRPADRLTSTDSEERDRPFSSEGAASVATVRDAATPQPSIGLTGSDSEERDRPFQSEVIAGSTLNQRSPIERAASHGGQTSESEVRNPFAATEPGSRAPRSALASCRGMDGMFKLSMQYRGCHYNEPHEDIGIRCR